MGAIAKLSSSFFRQSRLSQALNDHWRDWPVLQEPFDRELRFEATRLRRGEFRLDIVPLRGLRRRQKGIWNKCPVSSVNCSLRVLGAIFNRSRFGTRTVASSQRDSAVRIGAVKWRRHGHGWRAKRSSPLPWMNGSTGQLLKNQRLLQSKFWLPL